RRTIALRLHGERPAVVTERHVAGHPRYLLDGLQQVGAHAATSRTGRSASRIAALSTPTVVTPSCRMPATRAASAPPRVNASRTWPALPAPPDAMTGTCTASATARVSARS